MADDRRKSSGGDKKKHRRGHGHRHSGRADEDKAPADVPQKIQVDGNNDEDDNPEHNKHKDSHPHRDSGGQKPGEEKPKLSQDNPIEDVQPDDNKKPNEKHRQSHDHKHRHSKENKAHLPTNDKSRPPTDDKTRPPTDDKNRQPADDKNRQPTDDKNHPPTDNKSRPPTDDKTRPKTDDRNHQPADDKNRPPNDERRPVDKSPVEGKGASLRDANPDNAVLYDAKEHHPSKAGKLLIFNVVEDPFDHPDKKKPDKVEPVKPEAVEEPRKRHRKHRRKPTITSEPRTSLIPSENIFEKVRKKRKPRLEQLLNMLGSMEKPQESNQVLSNMTHYGIPEQKALLDFNLLGDPHRHDFGGSIKLMYSPALRSIAPINFSNFYLPASESIASIESVRYKGVRMKSDEFVHVEQLKAAKRHERMDEVKSVAVNDEHFVFLRNLATQQISSLPLTIMHDVLYEQIQVVEKYCDSYSNSLGSTNPSTTVAVSHYNLMEKHLEAFQFMGLSPMPPLCVTRKFEQPPTQEKQFVTSSSSSEDLDELETFMKQGERKKTKEEMEANEIDLEDELILQIDASKKTGAVIPDIFIGNTMLPTAEVHLKLEAVEDKGPGVAAAPLNKAVPLK